MEEAKGKGEEGGSDKGGGKETIRLQSRTANWGKIPKYVSGSCMLCLRQGYTNF